MSTIQPINYTIFLINSEIYTYLHAKKTHQPNMQKRSVRPLISADMTVNKSIFISNIHVFIIEYTVIISSG